MGSARVDYLVHHADGTLLRLEFVNNEGTLPLRFELVLLLLR